MNTFAVFKSIVSLFLIMIVGVVGRKRNIITNEGNKGMIEILLRILLPLMIICSFSFSYDDNIKSNVFKAFYFSFIAYLIIIGLSLLFTKPVRDDKKIILHFANVFPNTGYVGFPILNSIYGPEAVMYGSIFNMFFVLFLWTYGIMIFKGKMEKDELKRELIKALLNPSVIAVYIGLAMMVFNITLPDVVFSSINSVGSMTGPLSMIIVGAMLSGVKIKNHLKDWTVYYGIFIKMILIPAILIVISMLIKEKSIVSNSVIILAAMPSAAMTPIFAQTFNFKKEYATIIMVITTLFSTVTIPILLRIIL